MSIKKWVAGAAAVVALGGLGAVVVPGVAGASVPCGFKSQTGANGANLYGYSTGTVIRGRIPAWTYFDDGQQSGGRVYANDWGGWVDFPALAREDGATCY
jgi:hypothetical protein